MSLRRGFKAEANRISLRVRDQMRLTAVDPIDPKSVCGHFEIQLIPLSSLDCGQGAFLGRDNSLFSAVTVPSGIRTAIVHNDSHHEYRQRSNICHELAHCFLGHKLAPPLMSNGDRSRDSGIEEEANFLAGALLIPNEAALHILVCEQVEAAQANYGVSKPMLEFRLRVSGARTIYQRRKLRR